MQEAPSYAILSSQRANVPLVANAGLTLVRPVGRDIAPLVYESTAGKQGPAGVVQIHNMGGQSPNFRAAWANAGDMARPDGPIKPGLRVVGLTKPGRGRGEITAMPGRL